VLADFIQLGQTPNGTRSLAETKGSMFATAMGALLDGVASVINRHAIPRLLRLNGMATDTPPQFVFDDIEYEDLAQWTEALGKMAAAGMPVFPDPAIEAVVREKLDLPELTEEQIAEREQDVVDQKEMAARQQEAEVAGMEREAAGEDEKDEEKKPFGKVDEDALVAKVLAGVPDHTPQFDQLTLKLDGLGTRLEHVESKASDTAIALQGVCLTQEAMEKREREAMTEDERTGAIAARAAARVMGIEPITKDDMTDGVAKAVGPVLERTVEVLGAAIGKNTEIMTKAVEAMNRKPTRKLARKLEDGTVEITET